MRVSTLNRNIAMMEMEQADNNKGVRDEVSYQRQQQTQAKLDQLNGNQEAAGLRGEAENIKSGCNAAASGIGIAAAVCACFPPIGTIIAAVLAAVAAVIVLIGQIMAKAKEDEAAAKEKASGMKDIEVDQHKNKADEIKKDDEDRKNYVDQFREKLSEMQKEQNQTAKF
ncbi:MAG: hypothetical protein U1E65_29305 [Myxococcota bacterium]